MKLHHTNFPTLEAFKQECERLFDETNALPKNKGYELPPMGPAARKMFEAAIEAEAVRRGWITQEQLDKNKNK